VEDNSIDVDLFRRELAYQTPSSTVNAVPTLKAAREQLAREEKYDIALIDYNLPDGSGIDLLVEIRKEALPMAVVILTGQGNEEVAVAALKAGADDYMLKKKDYLSRMPLVLKTALKSFHNVAVLKNSLINVLYIEDNKTDLDLVRHHLARYAPHISLRYAYTASEALQLLTADKEKFDVLLLDYRLPGSDGLDLLKDLKMTLKDTVPVILVTSHGDEEIAVMALHLGASDYVVKNEGYLFKLPAIVENAYHNRLLSQKVIELQESHFILNTILETTLAGFWDWNLVENTEYLSPTFKQMFGYEDHEMESSPEAWQKIIFPEDLPVLLAVFDRHVKSRGQEPFHSEIRYCHKGGSTVWVMCTGNVIEWAEDGTALRMLGCHINITKRKQAEVELERQRNELEKRMNQSVNAISRIGELRDVYTAGHQKRVAELAFAIGREMGLADEKLRNLSYGGLLHDVGKFFVPSDILNKPGKVSDLEYKIIQTHVEESYNVVKEIDFPEEIHAMIYQHHERLDGSGYPQGKSGDEIILESRILAVADVVEAMISHRPYRGALGIDAALEEIRLHRGTKYDEEVVDICVKFFKEDGYAF
jgi:PAS domain S-box-containing protein/putative nucleotidyltransferase with HDIG domain